jgi:hypothetical protein
MNATINCLWIELWVELRQQTRGVFPQTLTENAGRFVLRQLG